MKYAVKVILYILAFLVILSGVVCGIMTYKIITSKSYINGDLLGFENAFKQENFKYVTNTLPLYADASKEDYCTYEINLLPVEEFDGLSKSYEVILNDYEIVNAKVDAGAVEFSQSYEFLDVESNVKNNTQLCIRLEFLADKTKLKVVVKTNNTAYITQYFNNNQFSLRVNEIK